MRQRIQTEFDHGLEEARFCERPNRFLVRARLGTDLVEAHLPDPGRLRELLLPGRRLWLQPAPAKASRRTRWTVALAEAETGRGLVSLDSTLPNRLVRLALERQALAELAGWRLVRPEVRLGHHRFDFLLADGDDRQLVLEVKSVTLVDEGIGLFPDAVTERGRRHVEALAGLVEKGGHAAAVLFVVQRNDVREIRPAGGIDAAFAEALEQARRSGVRLLGRLCQVEITGLRLGAAVPVETGAE